jgi:chitinase
MKVGYYEAFNLERPCLNMWPSQIDPTAYTHIHFAFASVTSAFAVDVSASQDAFTDFVQMNGPKKILSFGGWSFSTDADSYPIFREGVTDMNRLEFANNVVQFVENYGLDGVDFDWEYPGAPDIPGRKPFPKSICSVYT